MAILKKRTSSRQLPEARGIERAPLDSIIRGVGKNPSISGGRPSTITSAGGSGGSNAVTTSGGSGRPFTSTFTNPATTKQTLTSKTSSTPKTTLAPKTSLTTKTSSTPKTTLAPKTTLTSKTTPSTTTKPTITNKTTTTPTTKTTTGTNTVKPTVKPNVSNTNSTTNKVVNALTGAALGAGTKLLIDKITGKPTVVKTGSGGTGSSGTTGGTGGARPPAGGTGTTGGAKTPSGGTAGGTKPTAPVTSKVLTDEEVQAELDKAKNLEEPFTPPEGAVDNGDGTYSVTENGIVTTYGSDGSVVGMEAADKGPVAVGDSLSDGEEIVTDVATGTGGTRGLGGTTTGSTETEDTTVAGGNDVQYFQDDQGNYYTMNADGGYDLAYYADGSLPDDILNSGGDDTTVADNTWTDPDSGAVWHLSDSGTWTLEGDDSNYYDDSLYADNTDYTDNSDYLYAGNDDYNDYYDYTDYSDEEYAKRGGLITMMKKGGISRFAGGGYSDTDEEVQDWQNVDLRNLALDDGEQVENVAYDNADFTPVPGRQYFDDGSYIDTFDDGSTMTYDSDGNLTDTTDGYQTSRDDEGNYIVTDGFGNMTVYDPTGNVIPLGGGRVNQRPITNVGGGARNTTVGNILNPTGGGDNNIGTDLLGKFTGALGTTAGAAGAGALIATLLGSDFGGGTGNQNQGLDMSKVGVINPRTTDFGIGPTRFVGYEDYGTSGEDYTPNEELLRNLNAPGYNPVNEGDYGYEEVPTEETAEEPKMASGGLSSMATPVASYYTFGQPADILANLGMRPQPPMNPPDMMPQIGQQRPPEQAQQQGLPQQQPPQMAQQMPQGMPQQGMMPQQQGMAPPMRKGGLPHVSNVPMTQGRMDFRKGSAVHGEGDGQSDDIPAMLADGEYVIDAETVAQIGNGSTKAGAQALDKFRENIRAHKRSAPINKIPPKTKALTSYLKGAK